MKKKLLYGFGAFVIFLALVVGLFAYTVIIQVPEPESSEVLKLERTEVSPNFYTIGNNWLKKNQYGLYEMYVEGAPFERGVINGKLSRELVVKQEVVFIASIRKIIPSDWYLDFLKYVVAWFNRNLDDHIAEEYKLEIFGVSRALSDDYDFIGPKYQRILNYHAAHDIGHALQDKNYVRGCTSFSAWDQRVEDQSLLIGRNFDFSVGDEFAEDKIISFNHPDKGFDFMMVTWGGMIGAVSGMNTKGLTVTINAAKSDIPTSSATPIAILAREILQYAENIEEAVKIAARRETFVSESIMVGSWQDNQTAIIEKTPTRMSIKRADADYIVCSNHFQSDLFVDDPLNIENMETSDSPYRYNRMQELIAGSEVINPSRMAAILRDRSGIGGANIGLGNQKSINQLIAHHSIIFKPGQQLVWVSTKPWQLGPYIAYDLTRIFKELPGLKKDSSIIVDSLTIPADKFLHSKKYKSFLVYKKLKAVFKKMIDRDEDAEIKERLARKFVESNPEFYLVYSILGDYFLARGEVERAAGYYNLALTKEIPYQADVDEIKAKIESLKVRTSS